MKRRFFFFALAVGALFVGCGLFNPSDDDHAAPVITQQPRSQTVTVGHSVTFTVKATGTPPLSYQWRKNGTNISGTSDSFNIPSVQFADAGTFSVVVSNSKGSVTSSGAVLNLRTPPVMRYITGGTFQMGDTLDLEELPVHQVTVSSFYMDTTPVTQADYDSLMGVNPSRYIEDSLKPVEQVTWFDAVLYCNARSRRYMLDTVYSYTSLTGTPGDSCTSLGSLEIDYTKDGYRLPTEAEWEYACRAGTTTDYYWGGSYPLATAADTAAMDSNAVWVHNAVTTARIGTKLPNAYGLYDMIGNVWEWCNDWWNSSYYSSSPTADPTGSSTGDRRMVRGGAWNMYAYRLLSAERGYIAPNLRGPTVGFRCVRR
jgi:formylglycine-generating enzyme required for sulfatase activity